MMAWAWLLPALCATAFVFIVFIGKSLPGNWRAVPALLAILSGFVIFVAILNELLFSSPQHFSITWLEVDKYQIHMGMTIDNLTVLMLGVVTFCAFLIQLYSVGYMHGDPRFAWFFAVISLFTFAMLSLVLADNLLLLYMAWELVGLCSYLLIGFWWERRSAAEAAKKAFITTRIGDVGFFIGIMILWRATGTFNLPEIIHAAEAGRIDGGLLTTAMILIFAGAVGKSAQFPLHVWLPDAMEGPTPVSALIHAATMVAAGVYLVGRTFPLFVLAPDALNVVMIVGVITAVMAATMGLVMDDLKRILAYSTISQLGFMMIAMGVGSITGGMFHLMTHAFFKALLFLGAGSVIHSTGVQDIWQMGGLWKKMKITSITFLAGSLALAGIPPFAGFWSKDEILVAAWNHNKVVFVLAAFAAFLTAFYIGRLCFVVFFGKRSHISEHAHESPWTMTVPLIFLGVMATISGLFALPFIGPLFGLPEAFSGFGSFIYGHEPEEFHLDAVIAIASTILALCGILLAAAGYRWKMFSTASIAERFAPIHRLLVNKYYFDHMYQWIIDHVVLTLSRFIATFDRKVINDTGVDGPAKLTVLAGEGLKYVQTGKFYNYGLAVVIGILLVVALATMVRPGLWTGG